MRGCNWSGYAGVVSPAVVACAVSVAATSAYADYFSLGSALTRALEESPKMRAEEHRKLATDQDLVSAHFAFLPKVRMSLDIDSYHRAWSKPKGRLRRETFPSTYSLTLSQPLFDGMERVNNLRAAAAASRAGHETLRESEQSIALEAVTTYLAVYRDQRVLRLREDSLRRVRRIQRVTRAGYMSGATSITDVEQAKARAMLAKADVEEARGSLEANEAEFVRITGALPGELERARVPKHLIPHSEDEAMALASTANPGVRSAAHVADAARHSARAAASELLPRVDLEVEGRRIDDYEYLTDRRNDVSLRVGVNMPLFDTALMPTIAKANLTAHQRYYEAVDQRRRVGSSARANFLRYLASGQRAKALHRQVAAERKAVKGVSKQAEAGQATVIQVLDAELERTIAEVLLETAQYDRDLNAFRLLSDIGRLTSGAYDEEVAGNFTLGDFRTTVTAAVSPAPALEVPQSVSWETTTIAGDGFDQ